ncbi:MAG: hypothetical protein G01um101433_761 [Parcubacteria group bacterium Gr01-1014_33]|nr:MAG: hypothetical protein G01um101433_761 [Parcubacteria group bacterium Gr01-1014_33]
MSSILFRRRPHLLRHILFSDIVNVMATITIEIPKKILERGGSLRRLVVVDPKEFEKELRRRWELEDAKEAVEEARQAWKEGKARLVSDLGEVIKS